MLPLLAGLIGDAIDALLIAPSGLQVRNRCDTLMGYPVRTLPGCSWLPLEKRIRMSVDFDRDLLHILNCETFSFERSTLEPEVDFSRKKKARKSIGRRRAAANSDLNSPY